MNIPFKMNIAQQLKQLTHAERAHSAPEPASELGSKPLGKRYEDEASDALQCQGGVCMITWKPKRTAA